MCGIIEMARQRQHFSALRQHEAQQSGGGLSGAIVVHTDERKALAARRIRVERDDRNALLKQLVDALAYLRRVVRRDGERLHALPDQFLDVLEHQLGVQSACFAHDELHARGGQLLCGTLHACTHDLHGGRFGGLQNRAQLEIPSGFDERLPDQVGFIAEFGGYFVDLCGHFGIYAAAVVQCAVYRSAGYTRKIRDLLCGDSHCDSSLLLYRKIPHSDSFHNISTVQPIRTPHICGFFLLIISITHCTQFATLFCVLSHFCLCVFSFAQAIPK